MATVGPNELEKCNHVSGCQSNPAGYASYMKSSWSYLTPSAKSVAQYALKALEAARQKDVEAHERNKPKLEANKATRDTLLAAIKQAGIPDSYWEYPTNSRARYPKKVRHEAGYLGDIRRNLPITDGFESSTSTYNSLKARYDAYAQQAEDEEQRTVEAAERERQAELERRRADIRMAKIILRYDLPEDSTWSQVLSLLRKKDQRLDLAVAMRQTRGDWSEGYYRVSDALDRFVVHTTEDAAIQTDILACFNDDIDGRVFRDTEWNYDRLFQSAADPQLAEDILTALSEIRDY